MVTQPIVCRHCGSPNLSKYGIAPNGKQKYRCGACGRQSRENPSSAGYSEERKAEILRAYQERSSLRGLERTFGVSRETVLRWLKKSLGAAFVQEDAYSASTTRSEQHYTRVR
jgi:transposase-like protein